MLDGKQPDIIVTLKGLGIYAAIVVFGSFMDVSTSAIMMGRMGLSREGNPLDRAGFASGGYLGMLKFSLPLEAALFFSSVLALMLVGRVFLLREKEMSTIRKFGYMLASQPIWYGTLANSLFLISGGTVY